MHEDNGVLDRVSYGGGAENDWEGVEAPQDSNPGSFRYLVLYSHMGKGLEETLGLRTSTWDLFL